MRCLSLFSVVVACVVMSSGSLMANEKEQIAKDSQTEMHVKCLYCRTLKCLIQCVND